MSDTYRRRPATLADFERVFAIHMHPEVAPYLGGRVLSRDTFRFLFEDMLATRDLYVFERDRQLLGFYRLARHPGRERPTAYLGTIAIDPILRGSGIARDMIEAAIAQARDLGHEAVELLVENDNPRAIAFYRKLGFEVAAIRAEACKRGEHQFVDEWTMRRALIASNGGD